MREPASAPVGGLAGLASGAGRTILVEMPDPVVVLDGCALTCASNCLARHGVSADRHYQLQEFGVRKKLHADFDPLQAQRVFEQVRGDLQEIESVAAPATD